MQVEPFIPTVKPSRFLRALLMNPVYSAEYKEMAQRVGTWSKTDLQRAYPHEYNSFRSRKASGKPFAPALRDFRMLVLDRCGHSPWRERHAVEPFYALMERELDT